VSSRPVAAAFAALLLLLAGCSERTGGSPSAAETPTSQEQTTEQSTEETTTESGEPGTDGGLADLEPCDILDSNDISTLQLTGGEERKIGSARVCEYRREGPTINESYAVAVGLWDDQGLGDLNAENITPLPNIGSHEAASYTELSGDCGIAIVVSDTSRVDVSSTGGDVQLGCQLTNQVAAAVEAKLP
jgi:hypothetical protein